MALEKIQKLSTFTDAEEGGSEGGRKGVNRLSLPEKNRRDEGSKGKDYDNIIYKRRL